MKDYLLLLDGNEKLKRIINAYEFYDDEIKSTTAGERVLTFKMNDSVVDIKSGNKIGVFIEGKFDLFIVDQVEAETYYSTSIKITCLHDFYSIQTQKAITQYYKESVSVHDAMTEMLKGTSYELGECVERSLIPIGPYLFKNPLWCIQDIISNFGVEINYSIELNETRTGIARKLVHVVNALGSDTGIRCSADLNVSKIKRIEKDKFYTVMYGCGSEYQKDLVKYKYDFKDISWSTSNGSPADKPAGQEFVEDKKAIAKYGRIIGIFEDGRIKDPELLLKKTWEALQKNNRPIVSYELDIEELKTEDGYEHLNFKLGDIIILQNTIDNSRAKFRIVEDCISVRNKSKRKVVVGEQLKGLTSSGNGNNGENIVPPGGDVPQTPDIEEITPDTLPAVPVLTAKGLWGKVMLSWTYENKMYYNYEVYASRIKDFEPIVFNMIYSGKASAFLHEAGADETWYYRVRAVNTFGNSTDFSEQVEAKTTKVADGTEYFESAAIKDALIEELRLDRGWIGQLDATYLKVRGKFTVVDGNNTETFKIDSYGGVHADFTTLTLKGEDIRTTQVSTYNMVKNPSATLNINNWGAFLGANCKVKRVSINVESVKEMPTRVHFIDIGDGLCVLIESSGKFALIDTGKLGTAINKGSLQYLKDLGVKDIDYFIITHHHSDHNGECERFLNTFNVKNVYTRQPDWSKMPAVETGWQTKVYFDRFYNKLKSQGKDFITPTERQTLWMSNECALEIFNTGFNNYAEYNDLSFGVLVRVGARRLFIAGDISYNAEAALKGKVGHVDYLCGGHHAYNTSNSDAWLDELSPTTCIFTSENIRGSSQSTVVNRVKAHGIEVYSTNLDGTIVVTMDSKNISHTATHAV